MSKFYNISTDNTLGGSSASNSIVSSQKAIKEYVDSQTGTAPSFSNITGQPTDNANLATALNAKYDASNPNGYTSNVGTVTSVNNTSPDGNGNVTLSIPAAQIQSDWTQADNTKVDYIKNKPNLATVATSGSYTDLSNKPTIPTAQVNSDWNAVSGVAQILNKPSLATVATTGAYSDLTGVPTTSYSADCPALTAVSGVCTWTVTHTLATKDVTVRVYEVSTGNTVVVNSSTTATDTVVISILSASDIAAGTYRIVLTK